MAERTRAADVRWVVIPDQRTLHVWIERPPRLDEWDELLDRLHRSILDADVVVLSGPGWTTRIAREMADVMHDVLPEQGVTVMETSPALCGPLSVPSGPGPRDR